MPETAGEGHFLFKPHNQVVIHQPPPQTNKTAKQPFVLEMTLAICFVKATEASNNTESWFREVKRLTLRFSGLYDCFGRNVEEAGISNS